jgi:hypothetical protein
MTDLAHDLVVHAREVAGSGKRDLLGAALAAARAIPRERGLALVHLAGALRDYGRYDEALAFLDLVESRYEDREVIRAAFTCAIAIHGDLGATALANTLCDEQRDRAAVDLRFLRAEIRARKAWLDATDEDVARSALHRAEAELERFVALSAV